MSPLDVPKEVLSTWTARFHIECEAAVRFADLARRLEGIGAPEPLVEIARTAEQDELRHARHCQRFVTRYGGPALETNLRLVHYAPTSLLPEQRLAYEVVAQSCVAETQSTSSLVNLLDAAEGEDLKATLHELTRDEVRHGRLGWGYLTFAQPRLDLSFLGPLLPRMIAGSAGPTLFGPPPEEAPADMLWRHGVVPFRERRRLYVETLQEVILPGFDSAGLDTQPVRTWLSERLAQS